MADDDGDLPRDAEIVKTLLESLGVDNYEPCVVHQFLDLWYRFVMDVLIDAKMYSENAGKSIIDSDDIKHAIRSKANSSFSQPPPRKRLLKLAENSNKIPLPKITDGPGMALRPALDMSIGPNCQLLIPMKQTSEAVEETEEEASDSKPNPSQNQRADLPQVLNEFPFLLVKNVLGNHV